MNRKWLGLAAIVIAGCTGEIGDPPEPLTAPAPSPMRRLTRFEYDNAVRDLLGDTTHPARGFAPDTDVLGFDNQTLGDVVDRRRAEDYMRAAEALAATATGHLDALLPCDPTLDEDACARAFIASFGERAFRRPLEEAERARLFELYAGDRASFASRIGRVIEAILQSPWFLYRVELPPDGGRGVVPLDGYAVASRLSFLIWASIPDARLLELARRGELATVGAVGEEARRMLRDPKARDAIAHFHELWLGLGALDSLSKDVGAYPTFNVESGPLWRRETLAFLEHEFFEGGGLPAMLGSPSTFVNGKLALDYGIVGLDPELSDFVRVSLDPSRASGFLTQPGVMARYAKTDQTSPVLRGKFVRERLLCQAIAPPPAGASTAVPPIAPGVTTRDRSEAHVADPACAGCHTLMDPIGFAFEHLDGVGRWRDTDQGIAIDATGKISGTPATNGAFDGVVALGARLAESEDVQRCLVRQWFTYGFGRPDTAGDRRVVERLERVFDGSNGDFVELVVAIAESDAFRFQYVDD